MRCIDKKLYAALAALSLAALAACAPEPAGREYQRELAPLVGHAPVEYFLDRYGEPDRRTRVDAHTEVLRFTVAEEAYGGRGAHVNVATRLELTFRDGVLAAWRASNAVR